MNNIVILDGFTAIGQSSESTHKHQGGLSWNELATLGNLTAYDRTAEVDTVDRAREAEIVLTNKVLIRRQEMEQLPRLRYIGVLATGYNVVDIDAARERGIVVTNVPAYSTESVAQMVFAHLLGVTNRTEHYARENRNGRWSACPDFCYWDNLPTASGANWQELAGKTMGIIGLGNIGSRVAAIASAFGMRVLAFTSKQPDELPAYIKKGTIEEVLTQSDVVSLHCPLTDGTRHLIRRETLQLMKPAAILINTGRGPLVCEEDVAEALMSGGLYAYCADVLSEEPARITNPLLKCDNAFLTPHIAWATPEARTRLVAIATDNVRAFLNGKPQNVVS